MNKRILRKKLFNELLNRTGYVSRDDFADDLNQRFDLDISGSYLSNRLRVDRQTHFSVQEFLAIVETFTVYFNYQGRITAFEALLLWEWSAEIPRKILSELRAIWVKGHYEQEFNTAYDVFTQWSVYSQEIDWFDTTTRRSIETSLSKLQRLSPQLTAFESASTQVYRHRYSSDEFLKMLFQLHQDERYDALAHLHTAYKRRILEYASMRNTSRYFEVLNDLTHYLVDTKQINVAHDTLEIMTDLAFASSHISDAQRAYIRPYTNSQHDILKARALMYHSYQPTTDINHIDNGLLYTKEALGLYRTANHPYGETDALIRTGMFLRKIGDFSESILRLSLAKDVAQQIQNPDERTALIAVARATECYTAYQFVKDRHEIVERYMKITPNFPSEFSRIDYLFSLAIMFHGIGDNANAKLNGLRASSLCQKLGGTNPIGTSEIEWRAIAAQNNWYVPN